MVYTTRLHSLRDSFHQHGKGLKMQFDYTCRGYMSYLVNNKGQVYVSVVLNFIG
jgi:hypothetical protein